MNEFVEQFLIECRELIEQATDDLLTLESRPDDAERIDGAFRAFHTLKGAAGIVDFDAMARALHAAEDVLSSVRAGDAAVTPDLIDDCLTCLDQVVQWLDAMQDSGEIPPGAEAAADIVVQRFERANGAAAPPVVSDAALWRDAFLARHPGRAAHIAVRYAPDDAAFLRGEDPLTLLATLPDLLVLDLEECGPWPAPEDLDPFSCGLTFLALAGCEEAAARAALASVAGQVEIVTLDGPKEPDTTGLSAAAQGLLEAQLEMLESSEARGLAGRVGSAAKVAASVLRRAGRSSDFGSVDRALAASQNVVAASALSDLIRGLLSGAPDERPKQPEPDPAQPSVADLAARTLRVDVQRIDALVRLTGELLVAKNALGHASAQAQNGADVGTLAALLKDQHEGLGRLVDELQRSVLNIRVLQMRYVFQRFPRLVREMAAGLGKPAHLVTEGDDTEADKVIVESLFEPLLHVLRNALDHGIETPAARLAAGKPASATVTLRARCNENVVVEVEDDGGGIEVEGVRTVAANRGVASRAALDAMTDSEVINLIFAPGFSTAAKVTSLSGRGVGLDAVRTAIERLGGRVTIETKPGAGTVVRFTLPFTILMSRVLTVEAGGQLFGIPLEAVLETVQVNRSDIKLVGGGQAFVLRNRTVPLIDLGKALGRGKSHSRPGPATVVVAVAGGHLGAMEIERLDRKLDVMLKPLDGLLSGMPGIAGTTLIGDGRVLLVLDLQELLR